MDKVIDVLSTADDFRVPTTCTETWVTCSRCLASVLLSLHPCPQFKAKSFAHPRQCDRCASGGQRQDWPVARSWIEAGLRRSEDLARGAFICTASRRPPRKHWSAARGGIPVRSGLYAYQSLVPEDGLAHGPFVAEGISIVDSDYDRDYLPTMPTTTGPLSLKAIWVDDGEIGWSDQPTSVFSAQLLGSASRGMDLPFWSSIPIPRTQDQVGEVYLFALRQVLDLVPEIFNSCPQDTPLHGVPYRRLSALSKVIRECSRVTLGQVKSAISTADVVRAYIVAQSYYLGLMRSLRLLGSGSRDEFSSRARTVLAAADPFAALRQWSRDTFTYPGAGHLIGMAFSLFQHQEGVVDFSPPFELLRFQRLFTQINLMGQSLFLPKDDRESWLSTWSYIGTCFPVPNHTPTQYEAAIRCIVEVQAGRTLTPFTRWAPDIVDWSTFYMCPEMLAQFSQTVSGELNGFRVFDQDSLLGYHYTVLNKHSVWWASPGASQHARYLIEVTEIFRRLLSSSVILCGVGRPGWYPVLRGVVLPKLETHQARLATRSSPSQPGEVDMVVREQCMQVATRLSDFSDLEDYLGQPSVFRTTNSMVWYAPSGSGKTFFTTIPSPPLYCATEV